MQAFSSVEVCVQSFNQKPVGVIARFQVFETLLVEISCEEGSKVWGSQSPNFQLAEREKPLVWVNFNAL